MARLLQMLFGAGALLACACVCSAQAALELDTSACSEAWASGLPRFIAIELEGKSESALAIEVRCAGASVEIRARASEGVATQRRMELSGTPDEVRGRVVALAVAGLVKEMEVMGEKRANTTTSRTTTPTTTPTAPTPASTPAPASPSVSMDAIEEDEDQSGPYSVQLELFFAPSLFTAASDVVWGAGVRGQLLSVLPIYLALDAQLGMYGRDEELGSGRLVAGSFAGRAGYALESGALLLAGGVGPRVGYARASARASDGESTEAAAVSGVWIAPVAFVRVDTGLGARVRLALDAELGAVLVPVRGRVEGGDDIAADGAWLALSVSIGLRF